MSGWCPYSEAVEWLESFPDQEWSDPFDKIRNRLTPEGWELVKPIIDKHFSRAKGQKVLRDSSIYLDFRWLTEGEGTPKIKAHEELADKYSLSTDSINAIVRKFSP